VTVRPIRFDQVIPSIAERDAVSHHTLETQRVLREMGFVSEIFAREMSPGMVAHVRPLAELPRDDPGRQWLCYQASIGSPAAEVFLAHPGGKVVTYHNITPAPLVEAWMPFLGEEVRLGRRQLPELAAVSETGIAVSSYNAAELSEAGFTHTAVASLMMERSNFDSVADARRRAELAAAKQAGGSDWLFVGQMLPHKCHQDVIKAFACSLQVFDPKARLHLIGRESCPGYVLALHRFIADLGISSSVDFAGSVSPAELAAYYQAADVLVCCSAHEGFCAPIIEAMHHGVPVVAYAVAAVPETVLDAGLLLSSKEPLLVATAAERVLRDRTLREALVERGRERARRFSIAAARVAFVAAVEEALERAG
jgi:glycosyltransferase involved in cell wall biosynthesis